MLILDELDKLLTQNHVGLSNSIPISDSSLSRKRLMWRSIKWHPTYLPSIGFRPYGWSRLSRFRIYIKTIGYYHNKAKNMKNTAITIRDEFNRTKLRKTREELIPNFRNLWESEKQPTSSPSEALWSPNNRGRYSRWTGDQAYGHCRPGC